MYLEKHFSLKIVHFFFLLTFIPVFLTSDSQLSMIPMYLEEFFSTGEMPYADLIVYPISPSIAIPHTYPLLDVDDVNLGMCVRGGDGCVWCVCECICVSV